MGHVQRAVEEAGIPTVSVFVKSFGHIPKLMGLSRSLITRHPMGRPLGAPGDTERQRAVVEAAVSLLDSSEQKFVEFEQNYRTAPPA